MRIPRVTAEAAYAGIGRSDFGGTCRYGLLTQHLSLLRLALLPGQRQQRGSRDKKKKKEKDSVEVAACAGGREISSTIEKICCAYPLV